MSACTCSAKLQKDGLQTPESVGMDTRSNNGRLPSVSDHGPVPDVTAASCRMVKPKRLMLINKQLTTLQLTPLTASPVGSCSRRLAKAIANMEVGGNQKGD